MLPRNPVGSWARPLCAQFAGSKLSPSAASGENPGSMALGVTSVTVYPVQSPTSLATLAMSPVEAVAELAPDEQPTSQHTDPIASTALRIVVNLPNAILSCATSTPF